MNCYTQSANHNHQRQSRHFKVLIFNFSTTCKTVKYIQILLGAREGKVDFVLPLFALLATDRICVGFLGIFRKQMR